MTPTQPETDLRVLPPEEALRLSLARYQSQPVGIRLFVRARCLLAPLASILAEVPPRGRILDVGCGHGLFANAMALGSPDRTVLGLDPSAAKIAIARSSGGGIENVAYRKARVQQLDECGFDAISILDVLYLLPVEQKIEVLRACRARVSPDGVVIVKTNDTRPLWKYRVARFQEQVMTGIGLTMGAGLHFLSREQNAALLELAAFEPKIVVLKSWLPYPHVMLVGRPA